jgi:CheY-like chemotaxis protein
VSIPAKILVVDDTPANVKLLVDVLTVKGYALSSAVNGEEALLRIAAEPPDLVLLDIMMPGLSGYDVCRKIASTVSKPAPTTSFPNRSTSRSCLRA